LEERRRTCIQVIDGENGARRINTAETDPVAIRVDTVIYFARVGTTFLLSVIILLFLLLASSMRRMSDDFLRARISLNARTIKRGIMALLGGFLLVFIISLSFIIHAPLEGVWEMPVLYAWLLITLYGSHQFFRDLYLPRHPHAEVLG
jgi:uncharacterized membrane protein (DUF485 family)